MKNVFHSRISERVTRWGWLAVMIFALISLASASAQTQTAVKIVGGAYHSLAVKQEGTVWAWGQNWNGQLGNGTQTMSVLPVQVQGLSGVTMTAVAAGDYHSLALDSQGRVWAWGYNGNGQLGDGTGSDRSTAVQVQGSLSGLFVIAIAAGEYSSYALTSDGRVWAWGYNCYGQLGNANTTSQSSPVLVSTLTGIKAIAAGSYHCLALTSGGAVKAWGYNGSGQLGDNSTTIRKTPVSVTGLSLGIQAIGTGAWHSFAIKSLDGSVLAWGGNNSWQLGDGSQTNRKTPVAVSGGLTGVTAIAGGVAHSVALKSDQNHTVVAWGYNGQGQLGDTTKINRNAPVAVNGLSGVDAVSAGANHGIALKQDGTVVTWGSNDNGQLGDGRSDYLIKSPVPVVNQSDVVSVATGPCSESCFLVKKDGSAWMSGVDGLEGLFSPVDSSNNHLQFSGGGTFNLFLGTNGSNSGVWAWGNNWYGQLGTEGGLSQVNPVVVPGISNAVGIAAGLYHGLALLGNGTLQAWGENSAGQLGTGNGITQYTPVSVPGLTGIRKVAAGAAQNLALDQSWNVLAWGEHVTGWDYNDEEIWSTVDAHPTPVQVLTDARDIASGYLHNLVVKENGEVWAWGDNLYLQCGNGNDYAQVLPARVLGIDSVSAVSAGGDHSLALKTDKTLWAWGNNDHGQLGDGTQYTRSLPMSVMASEGVVGIGGGAFHSLALREDGTVLVWGDCSNNALGLGLLGICRVSPKPVLGLNLIQSGVPTITITSSSTGVLGQAQTIQSNVTDTVGTVSKVEYYIEGIKVLETTTPFSFNWTPTTWGNFNFTAIATDSNGSTSIRSNKVTVNVPYDSDSNGLPDWWEVKYFSVVGQNPTALAPSGTGLTLLQSYQQGKNPLDYYNGVQPTITIVSGDAQTGAVNEILAQSLVVEVKNQSGQPLANAPVTFSVVDGGGSLIDGLSMGASLNLRTDGEGRASIQYRQGFDLDVTSHIQALASLTSVVFTSQTTASGGNLQKILGDNQTWLGGSMAPMPLMIELKDGSGNLLIDTTVQFEVKSGDAKILDADDSTEVQTLLEVTTNSEGRAWVYAKTSSGDGMDATVEAKQGSSTVLFTVYSSAQGEKIENLNPLIWLKADEGLEANAQNEVTRWVDQSGNSHHAVALGSHKPIQSTLLGSGMPAVKFDNNEDALTFESSSGLNDFTKGTTLIMVFRFPEGYLGPESNYINLSDENEENPIGLSRRSDDYTNWYGNDHDLGNNGTFGEGPSYVFSLVQKPNRRIELWLNGVLWGAEVGDFPGVVERVKNTLGKQLVGEISEMILLNYGTSQSARHKIELSLALKHGVIKFLPSPTFDPEGGHFENSVAVRLSSSYPGVQIYYSLDGLDPTSASTLYTGDITFDRDTQLKAIALYSFNNKTIESPIRGVSYWINDDDEDGLPNDWESAHGLNPNDSSDVNSDYDDDGWTATQEYRFETDPSVSDIPVFSVPEGDYPNTLQVSLSKNQENLDIVYTTDEVEPNRFSLQYQTPFTLSKSTVLKAAAMITTSDGSKFMTKVSTKTYWIGDLDHDGISDEWEMENGLDPQNPADALLDIDEDGLTALQEYLNGTSMTNPDTNGDGIPDGLSVAIGLNPVLPGLSNNSPLPTPPEDDPNDPTPFSIILDQPSEAILIP